jgi:plastocyanin domain-containing protein
MAKTLVLSMLCVLHFFALNAPAQENAYRASIDRDGVQRVEITGGSYYYEPDYIIVKVNVPVELTFRKTSGITPHNILIKAPEAGIEINEDMNAEPKTVTFTPLKTGKFDIYCDKRFLFFRNHREKGMTGILEVVE